MPLLQVRDFPEDLYEKLSSVARAENRSIAQETTVLLREALNEKKERKARRKDVLASLSRIKIKDMESFPDPADLIRQDRDR